MEGLAEHPRCPAGDHCVLHIDALLALLEDEVEELGAPLRWARAVRQGHQGEPSSSWLTTLP